MNKLTRFFLTCSLGMLSSSAFAAGNVVLENDHSGQQHIDNLPTLSQLVTAPELPQNIWWPGAVIANQAATKQAELDKRTVLERLAACKVDASPKKAAMLQSIIDQLEKIHIVGRLFTPLDPDAVRSLDGADVALDGEYQLYTRTSPPTTLLLMGAINAPGPVTWQPGTSVSHYLEPQERLSGGDLSIATIIYPDGATTTVPVAYWNDLHREATPGSIVWVGFTPCAEDDAGKSLQNDIVSLLTRRIPD